MKTCLFNFDTIKPHFYIVKLDAALCSVTATTIINTYRYIQLIWASPITNGPLHSIRPTTAWTQCLHSIRITTTCTQDGQTKRFDKRIREKIKKKKNQANSNKDHQHNHDIIRVTKNWKKNQWGITLSLHPSIKRASLKGNNLLCALRKHAYSNILKISPPKPEVFR